MIGVGVVARDAEGKTLWCASVKLGIKLEPKLTESKAILIGMELAAEMGHDRVVFESDCEPVVCAIKKKAPGCSSFHLLLDDIVVATNRFSDCSWSWIHRDGNKVAHELAHVPPLVLGRKIWYSDFPDFLCNLLNSDLQLNVN
ncbi:uncharacterized protein LOC110729276 [Chenopodium quinoa]|uniref:uncharacterized protein LOC110729276 n=1 Tax=Chenopodium quinoa TaxID=63459 RepID=UPI000B76EAC7|nr:uncharacterized protein LOC110729276 [Chenopodium quinoa]